MHLDPLTAELWFVLLTDFDHPDQDKPLTGANTLAEHHRFVIHLRRGLITPSHQRFMPHKNNPNS